MALSCSRFLLRASSMRNTAVTISTNLTQKCSNSQIPSLNQIFTSRFLSTSNVVSCTKKAEQDQEGNEGTEDKKQNTKNGKKKYVYHPFDTSVRYMKSNAYKRVYGDEPVWVPYRRNFRGQFPPETRRSCVRFGRISTGSPCPICRDEYLVVHYQNPDLLAQFISPYTGKLIPTLKTGVCQKKQFRIELEILKAYDFGTLQYDVPFRSYNYQEFYPQLQPDSESAITKDQV